MTTVKQTFTEQARERSKVRVTGPKCVACIFLAGLPKKDRLDVEQAMACPVHEVRNTVLVKLLREQYPDTVPGADSIIRHRKGECRGSL